MRSLSVLIISLLSFYHAYAQLDKAQSRVDWNPDIYREGKLYPGYVFKLDGDTVKGFIKAKAICGHSGMGSNNQNSVEFYVHESDRKPTAKFKASELKGYMIADKVYESIKYSGGLLNKPNFNIVVQDGAIRIYEWYSTVNDFFTIQQQSNETWADFFSRKYDTKLILAKNPNEPVEIGTLALFFTKKFLPMIADYPELAEKVKNKEKGYTILNLFDVIDEYNKWATAK